MFRLTQILAQIRSPVPSRRAGPAFSGPVVVWNLIRQCNLHCRHCYTASSDRVFEGELDTEQVFSVLADLKAASVPALILSGGEPMMRPDLAAIARRAREMGFYLGLSTNGTLIHAQAARTLKEIGFNYVGISLDGLEAGHDLMRGEQGAFRAALAGVRHCQDAEVPVGIRFTPSRENSHELPGLLQLMQEEGIRRLYLSHWNYAGRGQANRAEDSEHQTTRAIVQTLIETAWEDPSRELVTGNNDADGVFLLLWLRTHHPELAERARGILEAWGGNASGVGIANIDNRGNLHPDIFWWRHTLGNVLERPFGEIWRDERDPLLAGLRMKPRPVTGRCGACRYLAICGGNTRVRAFQTFHDPWAEDPGCYLRDEEILEDNS